MINGSIDHRVSFFTSIPAVTKLGGIFLAKLIVALWFYRIFLEGKVTIKRVYYKTF